MPSLDHIDAVRAFNRFYTRQIGALGASHLGTRFSLSEMRVLYELAHRDRPTATEIRTALGLDRGYLSRTLRSFQQRGLIETAHGTDRRHRHLTLTDAGREAFAPLEDAARADVARLLAPLAPEGQQNVVAAMQTIRRSLSVWERPEARDLARHAPRQATLRTTLMPSDLGTVVARHGVLYAQEFGYDTRFEALVARVVADFVDNMDPARERCWIAECDGEFQGCVFVVSKKKSTAQLRLLLVEPSARGLGLGRRLVDEVIRFSTEAGYKRIRLWTQSELTAARTIYHATGFSIVESEPHESFGKQLVAEVWEKSLA